MRSTLQRLAVIGAVGALVALSAGPVVAAGRSATTSAAAGGQMHPGVTRRVPAGKPHAAVFGCQTPGTEGVDIFCYGPDQIRTAYGIDKLIAKNLDGRGRTIVIIDAFQSPTLPDDLATFDEAFDLPDAQLTQYAPQGLTPFDPDNEDHQGWSGEITLDVEWAHAVAPGAKIALVLAKSSDDADILDATKWAVDHNLGDVISQSFGEAERCVDPKIEAKQHDVFQDATRKGITLFASSGDEGSAQPSCDGDGWVKDTSSPANDPLVTAVGGTQLYAATYQLCTDAGGHTVICANQDPAPGTYQKEVAWDEKDDDPVVGVPGPEAGGDIATGGGYSDEFHRPGFQFGIHAIRSQFRGVPDVAYAGSVNHGVLVTWQGAFWIFGGTSAGSPQWAGITAIAAQLNHGRLGAINDSLYALGRSSNVFFHDIRDGQNGVLEYNADDTPVTISGFKAKAGWDATTGLGSPKADKLVPALAFLDH